MKYDDVGGTYNTLIELQIVLMLGFTSNHVALENGVFDPRDLDLEQIGFWDLFEEQGGLVEVFGNEEELEGVHN